MELIRKITKEFDIWLKGKEGLIVYGARQVGKSTLLSQLLGSQMDVVWLNGDEERVQDLLQTSSSPRLKAVVGENKYIVIDEAQRIPNIGICLKIIHLKK